MRVARADQSQSSSAVQLLSSTMEIKFDEIPELTLQKTMAKFDEMILDMVRQQTGFALERIGEEIPDSQSVDAKGKTLDAELMLQVLETLQMEFHSDGQPHQLHVFGGLFTAERQKAIDEQFQNDPDLQIRLDEVIAKKREEWRAREACRKLVG